MDKQLVTISPLSDLARCEWNYAEMAVVGNMDWKLLWWAIQTNITPEQLVEFGVLVHREDRPDSELMKHITSQSRLHREHMLLILDMRMELIKQYCLKPIELLKAAAGDPESWKKWYDHSRSCFGGCVNQFEHLVRLLQALEPYRMLTSES